MGVRFRGDRFAGDDPGGFSYVVGPKPFGAPCFGRVVADEFWRGGDADISPYDFSFSRIPSDIEPEVVLDRLALLRGAMDPAKAPIQEGQLLWTPRPEIGPGADSGRLQAVLG